MGIEFLGRLRLIVYGASAPMGHARLVGRVDYCSESLRKSSTSQSEHAVVAATFDSFFGVAVPGKNTLSVEVRVFPLDSPRSSDTDFLQPISCSALLSIEVGAKAPRTVLIPVRLRLQHPRHRVKELVAIRASQTLG